MIALVVILIVSLITFSAVILSDNRMVRGAAFVLLMISTVGAASAIGEKIGRDSESGRLMRFFPALMVRLDEATPDAQKVHIHQLAKIAQSNSPDRLLDSENYFFNQNWEASNRQPKEVGEDKHRRHKK